MVDALLADNEAGGAKDALPLLAFTLERLYGEYGATRHLKLKHYEKLGRIEGSIEAAVERAFQAADADPKVPKDKQARLVLLRRGLIPWLAGIDPDTGAPRRRVARLSEIPAEALPLIDLLIDQRLLSTDVATDTKEKTIEPAHEALLRQWGLLRGWLADDAGLLGVLEGVKRASRDWAANGKSPAWLTHATSRLEAAEQLRQRADLMASLEPTDNDYLDACRVAEQLVKRRMRRVRALFSVLAIVIFAGLIGWLNQDYLREQVRQFVTIRPYLQTQVRPYVLAPEREQTLKPKDTFRECAKNCPEMVVVPAGEFIMGSPANEKGRNDKEGPQHKVVFAKPFAVSKFEVTFDEWDTCVDYGDCAPGISDSGYGRGRKPVINVTWAEAQRYVAWLSRITGKTYRLLSEAEWEYAARGVTNADAPHPPYPWGDKASHDYANYGTDQCCQGKVEGRDEWFNSAPVGQFPANAFGLHDMHGNVAEWVEDCFNNSYEGAPTDGSAWRTGDCSRYIWRGGSWNLDPRWLRSAFRLWASPVFRGQNFGFRVGRTLTP